MGPGCHSESVLGGGGPGPVAQTIVPGGTPPGRPKSGKNGPKLAKLGQIWAKNGLFGPFLETPPGGLVRKARNGPEWPKIRPEGWKSGPNP